MYKPVKRTKCSSMSLSFIGIIVCPLMVVFTGGAKKPIAFTLH